MTAVCEAEVQREARRVLPRMEQGAYLMPDRDGKYALRFPSGEARAIRVAGKFVRQFKSRGWLAPCADAPKNFVLSDAGKAWLSRAQAEDDPFAAQHRAMSTRAIMDEQGREQTVSVNEGESPLGWLRHRGHITAAQFASGERLRRDFTIAQMMPRLCADLSAPVVNGRRGAQGAEDLSQTVLAAKQRFTRALEAVGPVLSDLLFDVCCHLSGLEECERRKDWPRKAARVVLCIALDRLAAHYGFGVKGTRAAIRSWSAQSGQGARRP